MDFIAYFTKRYFSLAIFGRLYGIFFLSFMSGGGTGPIVLGLSFDRLGSYQPSLFLMAFLSVIAAILALSLPRVSKTVAPSRQVSGLVCTPDSA